MNRRWTFGRGNSRGLGLGVAASCVLLFATQGFAQNRTTYAQQADGTWNMVELFQPSPSVTYADSVTATPTPEWHFLTPLGGTRHVAGASLGEAWIGRGNTTRVYVLSMNNVWQTRIIRADYYTIVPEPATAAWLAVVGLAFLARSRRRVR